MQTRTTLRLHRQVAATLVEVALLLYLFLWHRTSLAVHHPWEWRVVGRRAALQHPMATWLDPPQNPICPFGHAAVKVGAVLLLARAAVWACTGRKWLPPQLWIGMYAAAALLALAMNLNAFLYLLPAALIEWTYVRP